jgi:hypothetical protein
MPSLSKKYGLLQSGSTEYDTPIEAVPAAEDVSIVTTTVNTLVGSDVQDVLTKLNRPSVSQLPAYSGSDLASITFYSSASQVVANRIAAVALTYSSGNPTAETWTIYSDTDGITVLKTYTITNTWSSGTLTNSTSATT